MNDISSDDILLLKQRLAEQEALNRALLEKLADREREIDHLQAQLDKLRGKVSRCIGNMPVARSTMYTFAPPSALTEEALKRIGELCMPSRRK